MNNTVIITGAAQGIGLVTTQILGSLGYTVEAVDIDQDAIDEVSEVFTNLSNIHFSKVDVTNENEVTQLVKTVREKHKNIYGIVNNAVTNIRVPLEKLSLQQWNEVLTTNLTGAFLLSKHAAAYLKESKGRIVNIASTRALMSEPNSEAYAASKGGLISLTHAMAISLSGHVTVNAISPGWIDVSMYKKEDDRSPASISMEQHAQHPAGRVGAPEDVGHMVEYLLSEKAEFITGQNFVVDGGMTKKMIYMD